MKCRRVKVAGNAEFDLRAESVSLISLGWSCFLFCSKDFRQTADSTDMLLSVKLEAKRIANPFCLDLGRKQWKAFRAGTTNSGVTRIEIWSELTAKEEGNLLGDPSK